MSDPHDRDPRDQDPRNRDPRGQDSNDHDPHDRDLQGGNSRGRDERREQAEPAEGAARGAAALRALGAAETEALASQLVWRVGRLSDDDPVTVRVGFATSARLFADLPKLKNTSDHEVETAIKEGALRVEWVGQPPA